MNKTFTTKDINFKEVLELWFENEHLEDFTELENVKSAIISDIMKRNGFYKEPTTAHAHLFKNYKVVKVLKVI